VFGLRFSEDDDRGLRKTRGSHHERISQKIGEIARDAKFDDFSMDIDQILYQKDPKTIKR
jgi:hypothetical protein